MIRHDVRTSTTIQRMWRKQQLYAVSRLVRSCMLGMLGMGFIATHSFQTAKGQLDNSGTKLRNRSDRWLDRWLYVFRRIEPRALTN